ncbi:outer dense fiber protein 2-like [Liolophura sinensis]|uniref:outer dense fiber protein 2-like n=1 Tax=Liolophura sinensis TaxID=3198878 RepID=UPI00315839D6
MRVTDSLQESTKEVSTETRATVHPGQSAGDNQTQRPELQYAQGSLQERTKQDSVQERTKQVSTETRATVHPGQSAGDNQTQRPEIQYAQGSLQERTKQLSDVDDRLQTSQSELHETTLQLQQSQQQISRLDQDLREKSSLLAEIQQKLDKEKGVQKSQREELAEVTQELRLTREQLQQQHSELERVRQDLTNTRRDRDNLSREAEKAVSTAKTRHAETESLLCEIDVLKEREKLAESRFSSEVTHHQHEIDRLTRVHQDEISQMQDAYAKLLSTNEELSSQIRLLQKDIDERKRQAEALVDEVRAQVRELEQEIKSKEVLLDSVQETVVLKDAEIARLEARICRFERDEGMRVTENWMSSREPLTESSVYTESNTQSRSSEEKLYSNHSYPGRVGVKWQNRNGGNNGLQDVPDRDGNCHIADVRGKRTEHHQVQMAMNVSGYRQGNNSRTEFSQAGQLLETSDTDSDRGMRRCFVERSPNSPSQKPLPASNSQSSSSNFSNHSGLQGYKGLVRTLTYDEYSSENSNNSNNSSAVIIPTRDSNQNISKSTSQSLPRTELQNIPRKSALKVNQGSSNSEPMQCEKASQNTSLRHKGRQIQKGGNPLTHQTRKSKSVTQAKEPSDGNIGRTFPNQTARRKSANLEVHDFENEVTAVQQFRSPHGRQSCDVSDLFPSADLTAEGEDAVLSVEDLQEKLRANELKQQEIDRELLSLETEFEVSQDDADISQ